MKRSGFFWPGLAVLGLGSAALWRQQQVERGRLSEELAHVRTLVTERRQVAAENQRLIQALPTPAEIDLLRATEGELSSVRADIASLQSRLRPPAQLSATPRATERFGPKSTTPAAEWQNAGNATSKASLETVLWAAAGGDVEAFARNLSLSEGKTRERAMALWESLPANVRAMYDTPERMLAFLSIKDVIIGTAEVVDAFQVDGPKPAAGVLLRLSVPDGKTRDMSLKFAKEGESWKLLVPESTVARYAKQVAGDPDPIFKQQINH